MFMSFPTYLRPITLLLAATALAVAQHADIEITVDSGRLVTDPRIGEAEFGEAPNPANAADEPGFEVDDGVFLPGQDLGFNALGVTLGADARHLWFWDGTGAVNFGPTSDVASIEHPVSMQSIMLTSAAGAGSLPGFLIAIADPLGGIHQDLEYILGTNPPADGVYLFSIELTSSSYAKSAPLYFVLASNVDELVHEQAVDYVATTFGIPEPSMSGAVCLAGLAWFARHRRRRQN
jgi:hypothetical protein